MRFNRRVNSRCFHRPPAEPYWRPHIWQLSRRALLRGLGCWVGVPAFCASVLGCGGGGGSPAGGSGAGGASAGGSSLTEQQLLDELEAAAFLYFWEQAHPGTGQVKDRALAAGNDSRTLSSIAATGFGLSALCIGDSRGFLPSAQILARVQATLQFVLDQLQQVQGFFYHFVDFATGQRAGSSEVSSIDTAILVCGILTCRAHFNDPLVRSLATQIYERIDWAWMLNGGSTLAMAWTPENGFGLSRWDHYSELMMLYLLAMASPSYPIPPSSWNAWSRPVMSYQGLTYISGVDPLFVHQYSHAWFDFRGKRDAYADYFQNSITAVEAHRLFCLSLSGQFDDYSTSLWGITESDSENGYVAWGGPPAIGPIDGTIVPCASAGSLPFLYSDAIGVLQSIRSGYPEAWQRYGFIDAFNPLTGWYDTDVVGIDAGITLLMAENQRTGFLWQTFMQNPEATTALELAGFQ